MGNVHIQSGGFSIWIIAISVNITGTVEQILNPENVVESELGIRLHNHNCPDRGNYLFGTLQDSC